MTLDAATIANIQECLADTATDWGASRWGLYAKCPRAHHLRHEVGVAPKRRASYFGIGSLVHSVLQYVQLGVMRREERVWGEVLEYVSLLPDQSEAELQEAKRLLQWYWAHWGLENAGWHEGARIVGVEQLLQAPADSPLHPYTARYDTLLEIGGEYVLPDTKTRATAVPGVAADGSIDDEYKLAGWKRGQAINPQFLGLAWLLQQELRLESPPAVMVNAIIKTKQPKFARVMVRITQRAVDQWAENQARVQRAVRAEQLPYADPCDKSPTDKTPKLPFFRPSELMRYQSCVPYVGAPCQYFDWCHGSDEQKALHYDVSVSDIIRSVSHEQE